MSACLIRGRFDGRTAPRCGGGARSRSQFQEHQKKGARAASPPLRVTVPKIGVGKKKFSHHHTTALTASNQHQLLPPPPPSPSSRSPRISSHGKARLIETENPSTQFNTTNAVATSTRSSPAITTTTTTTTVIAALAANAAFAGELSLLAKAAFTRRQRLRWAQRPCRILSTYLDGTDPRGLASWSVRTAGPSRLTVLYSFGFLYVRR